MTDEWKKHCPYDSEDSPGHREAWRKGWVYRISQDSVEKKFERMMDERPARSSWLQGYAAAEERLQEGDPEISPTPGLSVDRLGSPT